MEYSFTILGSGTSYGVPIIGCHCPTCTSKDPRDNRTRAAGWFHGNGVSIIFDVGADLRAQAIREDICDIDAVFLTHNHADHINGIDDLRGFTKRSKGDLPFYAREFDVEYIRKCFAYMFNYNVPKERIWDLPHLILTAVDTEPVVVKNISVLPIPIIHGETEIRGYRMGDFAYLTDCSSIPESSYPLLKGVRNIVIDGLHRRPHLTHFNFEGAIAATAPIGADNVYLTHISHEICHAVDDPTLPPGIHIAYDGLTIPVEA